MSFPASDPAVARRVSNRVVLGGSAIMALVVLQTWPDRRAMALLVALQAGHVLLGKVVHPWFTRRGTPFAGTLVTAAHTTLCLTQANVAGWSLAACFFAIYPVFATASHQNRESRFKAAWTLAAFAVVAALEGVPGTTVAACSVLVVVLYGIWEVRTGLLRGALAALESERSKLEAAQRRLVEQEKMSSLGMLAAGVAHEINNPMSYVTSNVRQFAQDLPALGQDPALAKEYVEDILPATIDGIQRVNAIVGDLRRFARRDPERMEEFDLNKEVAAAVRISQSKLNHGCTAELSLGEIPMIVGRPQEIARVVMNLLVNAAQAMREPGVVRVATRAQDEGVALEVADSGCGMSPETLLRLFEPFFTTKPVGEGTGLGLAVVHGIVEAHRGRIDVQSEVGRGTVFTVWLPQAPAPRRAAPVPSQSSNRRIVDLTGPAAPRLAAFATKG